MKPQPQNKLIGRVKELRLIVTALKAGRHVLIEGPAGVGKTRLAVQAAADLGRGVIRVDGDERFSEDKLTGWFDPPLVINRGYCPDAFVPGPLHKAVSQGSLLFINELNRLPEGVQNVLLPVLDEQRLEVPRLEPLEAAPGFGVIATQNPREFVGANLLSEALRDRFELLQLDYQSFGEEEEIVHQITGLNGGPLVKQAVFITRATRNHPMIKRGASVRAAASLALIAEGLGGVEHIQEAAALALPTRIEFTDDLEKDPKEQFALYAQDIAKKKDLGG